MEVISVVEHVQGWCILHLILHSKLVPRKVTKNTWSHKNSKPTGHPHPKPSLHDPYGPSYSSLPTRAWAARHQLPDSLMSVSFIFRLHWCKNRHHWQPGSLMTGSLFHGILKKSQQNWVVFASPTNPPKQPNNRGPKSTNNPFCWDHQRCLWKNRRGIVGMKAIEDFHLPFFPAWMD